MQENDEDWRDAIFNTAAHVTGLDEPEPTPSKPQPIYAEAKEEAPVQEKVD